MRRHAGAIVLFGLTLAWRFVQVRDLALPAWVDSVHHTLLVRILLEQGRLPDTWGPYLSHVPFYYHFGFHLTAAVFAWLTGLTGAALGQAVLIVGQVWQAVLALAVYALGWALWRDRTRALVAMILVGFVSEMPAFYATWGRYTLLSGLALMVIAMTAALTGRPVLLALLVAATSISHQYAFLLLLLFLAILIAVTVENRRKIVVGGLAGIVLALPWQWRVWVQGQRFAHLEAGGQNVAYDARYLWHLLGPQRNYVLLALALAGMAVVVIHLIRNYNPQHAGRYVLVGWMFLFVGLLGPWRIGPFRPDYMAIVLFLPAVLLAVEAVGWLRWPIVRWAAVLILVLWGVWETRSVVNPETVLATADDVAAVEWLDTNLPSDAVFVVDTVPWMAGWRGVDGGWWITPLTGRRTVLPPVVYGWGEPGAVQSIDALAGQTHALGQTEGVEYCTKLSTLVQETGATHYYTRSRRPVQCPGVRPIYQGPGRITIYGFVRE